MAYKTGVPITSKGTVLVSDLRKPIKGFFETLKNLPSHIKHGLFHPGGRTEKTTSTGRSLR